jgi:alkanesulfonate monooxygenase SsuD/methylene tetrahydromethanopterin reductase-like flavin-dependent oxidoreductase (luciferase family)
MALKLGLNLGYWGIGPQTDDAVEIVQAAERIGFDSVWAAESYGSDAVSVLGYLAGKTETIQLGAAIFQVPARAPAAAAMAGVTIDALSGGRFIFGFGPSGPQVSEGWYGARFDKPLARTREFVGIVRKALARERLAYSGEALDTAAAGRPRQGAEAHHRPGPEPAPDLHRRHRSQEPRADRPDRRRLARHLLRAGTRRGLARPAP